MAEPNAAPRDAETTVEEFNEFYRASREDVTRGLVLAVGAYHLGLEAADEAFARAFERWGEVATYRNREGWVYRVGLNWARSRLRRRQREVSGWFEESSYTEDLPELDLLEAVASLPVPYRSVLVARFFMDWSIEDTAEALGMPEGTVKTRQHRALRRLRRRLEVST